MRRKLSIILCLALLIQLVPVFSAVAAPAPNVITTILEENDSRLTYEGKWSQVNSPKDYYGGKSAFSADRKAAVSTSFIGTGFRYTGTLAATHLPLEVWIDGALHSTIVTKSNSTKNKQTLFETMNLPYGTHDVRIVVAGGNTGNASSNIISVDQIEFIVKVIAVPEGVSISQDDQSVTVSWRSSSSALSYNVYRSIKGSSVPVKINDFPISSTRFVDEEVKLASIPSPQTINYQVSAIGDGGIESELSSIKSINLPSNNVNAPSGLKANVRAGNIVALSWKDEDNAIGYRIFRSDAKDGTYELIGDEFLNPTNSFTDQDIQGRFYPSKATVYYKISAVGQYNESALSGAIPATMNATQGPTNLLVDSVFDDEANEFNVSLQWTSVDGAIGYKVYQQNSTNKVFTPIDNQSVVGGMAQFSVENRNLSKDSKTTYAVTAVDSTGYESAFSRSVDVVIPKNTASTPKQFRANNVNNIISLSWSPSSSAVGYKVFRSPNRDKGYTLISGEQLVTNTAFVDSSFAQLAIPVGRQYFYKIQAVNRFGEPSTYTHHVTVTRRAPSKPQPVDINYSDRLLTLQWPQVAGAVQYKVYTYVRTNHSYSLVSNETVTSNSYQYQFQDKHQPTDLHYYYAVSARDNAGNESSLSNKISLLIPNTVPGVPSRLNYVNNNNAITLSWTASKNAVGYNIYRSTSKTGNSYTLVNQDGPINANEYVDLTYSGLNVQSTMKAYYKVTAVNRFAVQSQQSSILTASFTTPKGPNITSTELVNDHLQISWNPVQGATGYVLLRSMQSDKNFVTVASQLTSSSYDDNVAAATFNSDTTYYYMVRSIDALGQESKNSSVASATVPVNTASVPVGVTATVYNNSNVTLNWMLSNHATSYNVYKQDASGTFVQLATGVTGTSYVDIVVTEETKDYVYAISAVNLYGTESAISEQAIATVEPPSTPQNLSVVYDESTANLTWEAVDGVNEYRIYRSTQADMGFTNIGSVNETSTTTQLVTGTVETDFTYYYAISAVYPEGHESALSNIGSAAVSANIASAPSLNNYSVTVSHQVTLNWDTSIRAVAYNIYRRSITDNTEFSLVNVSGPVTGTSFVDTQLSSSDDVLGDSFGYIVRALNAYNSESTASNELQVLITAPVIPSQVTATVTTAGDSVTVNWSQSEGAIGYRVYRSNNEGDTYTLISTDIVNGLSYTDPFNFTMHEGFTFEYAVTAIYHPTFETQKSTSVQAFIGANAASIPDSVTADWLNGTTTVAWSSATNAIGYKVYRQQDTGNYQLISGSDVITGNSFADETLAQVFHNSDTEYHYAVSATNQYYTESQKSDAATLFVEASPKLQLAAICTVDPLVTRSWRVRNDNAFPLTFTLKVVGSSQSTEYTIAANAEMLIDTIALVGTNTARILVNGVEHDVKENVGAECPKGPAVTSISAISNTTVKISFDKPLNRVSAETVTNYMITEENNATLQLNVLNAMLIDTTNEVILTTSPQSQDKLYELANPVQLLGIDMLPFRNGVNRHVFLGFKNKSTANSESGLIVNGGLETVSGSGVPDSWTVYADPGVIHNSQLVQNNVHSGTKAMKLSATNIPQNSALMMSQLVTLNKENTFLYKAKLDVEKLTNAKVQIYVNFYNSQNQVVNSVNQESTASGTGYQSLSVSGSIPNLATTARVYIMLRAVNGIGEGTIFADDLQFITSKSRLSNSSFEDNNTTVLADNWNIYESPGITKDLQIRTDPLSGRVSQKLSASAMPSGGSIMISQLANIEGNQAFHLSGILNVTNLTNSVFQLYLNFYDSTNQTVGSSTVEQNLLTNEFIQMERVGVTPVNATTVRVYAILRATGNAGAGTVLLDSINFSIGEAPLTNSDFETYTGIDGVANTWTKYMDAGVIQDLQVVNSPVASGMKAQKISGSNIPNGGTVMISQLIPTTGNKLYHASAMVNAVSLTNSKAQLYINFYDVSNQMIGSTTIEQNSPTNGYTKLERVGVTPSNAVAVRVYAILRATSNGGAGTFYIDSISFKIGQAPLINSDFESYSDGVIATGWNKYVDAGVVEDFQVVNSQVASGMKAQKISGSSMPNGASVMISQVVPIEGNKLYYTSAMLNVFSLTNSKAQIYLNFYDSTNQTVGSTTIEQSSPTNGYIQMERVGMTPANAVTVRVYTILKSLGNNASGTIYVDSINLKLDQAPLINSDFETYTGNNGVANGWTKYVDTGAVEDFQLVNSPVTNGLHAQKISGSNIPNNGTVMISQLVPVSSNKLYKLSGKINTQSLIYSKAQLYVNIYNSQGQVVGSNNLELTSISSGMYQILERYVQIPTGGVTARVYVIIRATSQNGSGTIFVDQVKFE